MGYDIEKEKREAIEAGRRALNSLSTRKSEQCKKLGAGRYVWRRIFQYNVETFKNGSGEAEYGAGKV